MGLKEDLTGELRKSFRETWSTRDGRIVPEPKDVGLRNIGVNLEATVLYADIDGSTSMVDSKSKEFAAEVYKSYLLCAVRVIKSEGGAGAAYDGDRVMSVFIGDSKNTSAVRCAMRIKSAVDNIINPLIKDVRKSDFLVRQWAAWRTNTLMAGQSRPHE